MTIKSHKFICGFFIFQKSIAIIFFRLLQYKQLTTNKKLYRHMKIKKRMCDMKKQIIILGAFFALLHGTKINAGPSAKERKAIIDSHIAHAYTEGFGEQSSSTELMKQETISKIKDALNEVRAFVSNSLWVKSILIEACDEIQSANNKLIDSVRLSRSTDDSATQDKMTHNFLDIITKMNQLIERLEKKWYISEVKGLARQLLINAARHIRDAAQHSIEAQKKRPEGKKMAST